MCSWLLPLRIPWWYEQPTGSCPRRQDRLAGSSQKSAYSTNAPSPAAGPLAVLPGEEHWPEGAVALADAGMMPDDVDGFASFSNGANEAALMQVALGVPQMRWSSMV